jgi:hypothetical protein
MSLDKISAQLASNNKTLPPVEQWDPPYCGDIDIQIKNNGDWFHNGSVFKRLALVKLFASVLIKEEQHNTSEYFLVTPVEKVKITVDDAPFVITQWQWQDDQQSQLQVTTNLDDVFTLGKENPITTNTEGDLYVLVRRNLLAKVHRNVYYQWVAMAHEIITDQGTELVISSDDCQFSLGRY